MFHFLKEEIPKIFLFFGETRAPSVIVRDYELTQIKKVEDEPIPLQCLARAHDFIRGGSLGGVMSNNILKQVGTKSGRIFFAINSGYFIAGGEKDDALQMTKSRIQIYDDGKSTLPRDKSKTIENARLYFGGMHIVEFEESNSIRYKCDCKAFWKSNYLCSHILAAMHFDKVKSCTMLRSVISSVFITRLLCRLLMSSTC